MVGAASFPIHVSNGACVMRAAAAYGNAGRSPNSGTAKSCGEDRSLLRTNAAAMRAARAVFPHKTAVHLAQLTGYSQRAVEYWLSGANVLPSDALAALLNSEWGLEFLSAVMVAQPRWWQRIAAYFAAIDAQRLQRAARRRLREAIDADSDLTASIARAEAALAVCDPDFHRPHLDALGAIAGAPHRAVAAPAGRRGGR